MAIPFVTINIEERLKFKVGMRTDNEGVDIYNVNGSVGWTWIELEFKSAEDAIAARDAMNKCASEREL